ncbi:MAG: ribose 5-phosphate isomerase B [Phycisphaeraceae bacterium]
MRVAIAADHRGVDLLKHLSLMLEGEGCTVLEMQKACGATCDYPDMAYPVAKAVATGDADRGLLVCGSGIGMSIAANKVRGVRAALVHDEIGAAVSRRHNDANVLCLAADLLGMRVIERIVHTWLTTEFEGGRHARRVQKIAAIENGQSPQDADVDQTSLAETE